MGIICNLMLSIILSRQNNIFLNRTVTVCMCVCVLITVVILWYCQSSVWRYVNVTVVWNDCGELDVPGEVCANSKVWKNFIMKIRANCVLIIYVKKYLKIAWGTGEMYVMYPKWPEKYNFTITRIDSAVQIAV